MTDESTDVSDTPAQIADRGRKYLWCMRLSLRGFLIGITGAAALLMINNLLPTLGFMPPQPIVIPTAQINMVLAAFITFCSIFWLVTLYRIERGYFGGNAYEAREIIEAVILEATPTDTLTKH